MAEFDPHATHWVMCNSFTHRGKGELPVLNEQCYGTGVFCKMYFSFPVKKNSDFHCLSREYM